MSRTSHYRATPNKRQTPARRNAAANARVDVARGRQKGSRTGAQAGAFQVPGPNRSASVGTSGQAALAQTTSPRTQRQQSPYRGVNHYRERMQQVSGGIAVNQSRFIPASASRRGGQDSRSPEPQATVPLAQGQDRNQRRVNQLAANVYPATASWLEEIRQWAEVEVRQPVVQQPESSRLVAPQPEILPLEVPTSTFRQTEAWEPEAERQQNRPQQLSGSELQREELWAFHTHDAEQHAPEQGITPHWYPPTQQRNSVTRIGQHAQVIHEPAATAIATEAHTHRSLPGEAPIQSESPPKSQPKLIKRQPLAPTKKRIELTELVSELISKLQQSRSSYTPARIYHTLLSKTTVLLSRIELLDKRKREMTDFTNTRDCFACGDIKPTSEVFRLGCHHSTCGICTISFFTSMLAPGATKVPMCCGKVVKFTEDCRLLMAKTLFERTVGPDYESPDDYTTFLARHLQELFVRASRMLLTQQPLLCHICEDWLEHPDPATNIGTCANPSCGARTCVGCREEAHPDNICPNKEELEVMHKFLREDETMPCPRCSFQVTRVDGCNHIACRCGAEFCFKCGIVWTEECATSHMMNQQYRPIREDQFSDPELCDHQEWTPTTSGLPHQTGDVQKQICRVCNCEYLQFWKCRRCGISGVCDTCKEAWKGYFGGVRGYLIHAESREEILREENHFNLEDIWLEEERVVEARRLHNMAQRHEGEERFGRLAAEETVTRLEDKIKSASREHKKLESIIVQQSKELRQMRRLEDGSESGGDAIDDEFVSQLVKESEVNDALENKQMLNEEQALIYHGLGESGRLPSSLLKPWLLPRVRKNKRARDDVEEGSRPKRVLRAARMSAPCIRPGID